MTAARRSPAPSARRSRRWPRCSPATKAAASGVFITAWNPRSEPLSRAENEAAHRRLEAEVAALGLPALPHRGFGADPAWEPEEGLLVLGLDAAAALRLAEAHGQNAIATVDAAGSVTVLPTRLMQEGR
ncbi:MAG: DUF3293 domain-containing protein [Dongiaceae bacterium]